MLKAAPYRSAAADVSGGDPVEVAAALGFTMDETLAMIASSHLGLSTLETRMSDGLDFREHAVSSIREALRSAYRAGEAHARRSAGGAARGRTKPEKAASKPREGNKRDLVAALLLRPEGTTSREILDATGWPAVSVPQQAKASRLELRKVKAPGEPTRYFGTLLPTT